MKKTTRLRQSTSPDTDTLVLFTLAMSKSPLTVDDLVTRTGKSYNTVRRVLLDDNRVQSAGKYPTYYFLAKPEQLDYEYIQLTAKQPDGGWVAWMSKIRPKLSQLTELNSELHTKHVLKQGAILEALGINLVSLGRDLQMLADEPDWYERIGGNDG